MKVKAQIMDEAATGRALRRIAHEIAERNHGVENIRIVGVHRRGEPMAQAIASNIEAIEGIAVPCGALDVSSFRDDISRLAIEPADRQVTFPFDITDRDIILVDDVLYTGRTVRAAIEALFSCGRPRSIQLAVLVDRGHRELPIRADYVGKNVPTSRAELVAVRFPQIDGETGVFLMETGG